MAKFADKLIYHEAGHVGAGRKFGLPITCIDMSRDGDSLARVEFGSMLPPVDAEPEIHLRRLREAGITYLAGPIAEWRFSSRKSKRMDPGWEDDRRVASNCAMTSVLIAGGCRIADLGGTVLSVDQQVAVTATFKQWSEAAGKLVVEIWPTIEQIAALLKAHPFLFGSDLDERLRQPTKT